MLSILLAALLQAPSAAAVDEPSFPANAVVSPIWVNRPTASELARVFPADAAQQELNGRAVAECTVDAGGRLTSCRIVSEDPADYGFGEATLRLTKLFRMKTADQHGEPVEGRPIRVPIRHRLPVLAQTTPIKLVSAQWAGRSAEVDCRVVGSVIDNCAAIRATPFSPEFWAAVAEVPPGLSERIKGVSRGRIVFKFEFVPPPTD